MRAVDLQGRKKYAPDQTPVATSLPSCTQATHNYKSASPANHPLCCWWLRTCPDLLYKLPNFFKFHEFNRNSYNHVAEVLLVHIIDNRTDPLVNTKLCKKPKTMTGTLALVYSFDSTQWKISNEYQHDKVYSERSSKRLACWFLWTVFLSLCKQLICCQTLFLTAFLSCPFLKPLSTPLVKPKAINTYNFLPLLSLDQWEPGCSGDVSSLLKMDAP